MKADKAGVVTAVAVCLVARWSIGLHPHSGQGKAPMYGDYEAQRHWMEVTTNLPVHEWYRNTTNNNLQYWGLDYPPLTAYHSWLCGMWARALNTSFVKLHSSRGYESYDHKLFMRATVLAADLVTYIPAVICYYTLVEPTASLKRVLLTLLFPGLLLIDYGHFQYNCVSLGLTLFAVTCMKMKRMCLGALLFTLSINYKQMELYHALPFFFYILGKCWSRPSFSGRVGAVLWISVPVLFGFAVSWLPFLSDLSSIRDVATRLFPFNRGLYEDKVANFWCSISVMFKVREWFDLSTLVTISGVTTLLSVVPMCFLLFFRPTFLFFRISLIISALAFFLFSFQVHEKSILLSCLPALLVIHEFPFESFWFLMVSVFSMLPLLIKDNLLLGTVCLLGVYVTLGVSCLRLPKGASITCFYLSLLGFVLLSLLLVVVSPPPVYPDLWPVLISIYSCGHFILFFCYFYYILVKEVFSEWQ